MSPTPLPQAFAHALPTAWNAPLPSPGPPLPFIYLIIFQIQLSRNYFREISQLNLPVMVLIVSMTIEILLPMSTYLTSQIHQHFHLSVSHTDWYLGYPKCWQLAGHFLIGLHIPTSFLFSLCLSRAIHIVPKLIHAGCTCYCTYTIKLSIM